MINLFLIVLDNLQKLNEYVIDNIYDEKYIIGIVDILKRNFYRK